MIVFLYRTAQYIYQKRHDPAPLRWNCIDQVGVQSLQGVAASTTPVLVELDSIYSNHFGSNIQWNIGWILIRNTRKKGKLVHKGK